MSAPAHPAPKPNDPIGVTLAITAAFFALTLWRLTTLPGLYFDEIHYVPAARILLDLESWPNAEHPPLGKLILAASIVLFGDNAVGWRLPSALAGTLALFAFSRALWFASERRPATIGYALLLASGFHLFVHARIAILDGLFIAFLSAALWQAAGAVREPETGNWRLALCGLAIGAGLATKWTMIPFAPLFGLTFLTMRLSAGRRRLLLSRRGAPVPGVTLYEAFFWLGIVPGFVYVATFIPAMLVPNAPLVSMGLWDLQQRMLEMQQSVKDVHTYQSVWYQWVLNLRPIWYFYEPVEGIQRGVLMVGNPLTMLAGLIALVWCAWAGLIRRGSERRWDALAVFVLYAAALIFWIAAPKPVQFYYHYFAASCFLLAALALSLDEVWRRGLRWPLVLTVAASLALFAWFYPILSAAPLEGADGFARYSWLPSWI